MFQKIIDSLCVFTSGNANSSVFPCRPGQFFLSTCRTGAGLALAGIDAVLKLEKSADAIRVHIVRNRRAAKLDGVAQHLLECHAQPFKLGTGKSARLASWADSGAEKALVGIDIADAGEQRLVEQCGLDGELAAAEERGEVVGQDGQRLSPGGSKGRLAGQIAKLKPAKAPRIDEADSLPLFRRSRAWV